MMSLQLTILAQGTDFVVELRLDIVAEEEVKDCHAGFLTRTLGDQLAVILRKSRRDSGQGGNEGSGNLHRE